MTILRLAFSAEIAGSKPAEVTEFRVLVSVARHAGSGLYDELITHSEKSYCERICDLETPATRWHRPELGCSDKERKNE
jgi:hypothetical protein